MRRAFFIAVGGALGIVGRWWLETAFPTGPVADGGFPTTTLWINLIGSLAIGVAWALSDRFGQWFWAFVATGVLGGFTTFSTFAAEVAESDPVIGANYLFASLVLGPVFAALGMIVTEKVTR